jgi:hypothetical protein
VFNDITLDHEVEFVDAEGDHSAQAKIEPLEEEDEQPVEPKVDSYVQGMIDRFGQLLEQTQDWTVVKRNKKLHNLEFKRFDDPLIGVPFFSVDADLSGVKPSELWNLFKNRMMGKFGIFTSYYSSS